MSSDQTATVVVAACIEQDGKLLVCRRLGVSEPSIQHKWEFPGGRVRLGEEDLSRALRREVKEELGHVVKESPPARLVHAQVNCYDSGTDYLVLYFHCQVYQRFEGPDPERHLLLTPEEIVKDGTFPGFLPGTTTVAALIGRGFEVPPFSFAQHAVGLQSPEQTLLILTYELGKVIEYRHKANMYGETGYYSAAMQQKEMSDLISMVRYYCEQRGWNLEELMELGEEAYLERMEDLRKHGTRA